MKHFYSTIRENPEILKGYKTKDKFILCCTQCQKEYQKEIRLIKWDGINQSLKNNFCSSECQSLYKQLSFSQLFDCTTCGQSFYRNNSEAAKSKNHFCSSSCSATHNNKHKTHGTRRSKLEAWLETKLTELYPDLEIHFNRKDAIKSELDIYIPSMKLAFELNGIFHYEPIYGKDKLSKIQANDSNKFQQCQANNISLCIIDTSQQKRVTEKSSQKYLEIISRIIER